MLKLGLNTCNNAEYHADKQFLSSSNYKTLLTDPAKFYKEKILGEYENKQNNAFDEGSLTHSLILEPDLVASEYAFFNGMRKAGADYEDFKAAIEKTTPGKIIISKPQKIRTESYRDAYLKNDVATELLTGGESEATICAILNDIPSKIRCDYINVDKGFIADVKTSAYPVDVDTFRLTVKQWRYDLSAALYTKIAELHYGKPFDFYFVAIGKSSLICEVYKASSSTLMSGLSDIIKAGNIYKRCKESGIWESGPAILPVTADILEV